MRPYAPPVSVQRTRLMFLTKVDLAALMLHNFSAGMPGLILLSAGVIGDWSVLSHLVSLFLFLVKSGTVLRVLWRGGAAAAPRGQAPPSTSHPARRAVDL